MVEKTEKVFTVTRMARVSDYRFRCQECLQEFALGDRWARVWHFLTCGLVGGIVRHSKAMSWTNDVK